MQRRNCPYSSNHLWKISPFCPVFKKGDKQDPINYRLISLTCICCKLLEHIVPSNTMTFLENNNILYGLQHGFRSSRSCETQLVSFLQDHTCSDNTNSQTNIIVMDFAKAFDKVSHRHLLHKLHYYGINPTAINWISDYLHNRSQTVVLGGDTSTSIPVTSGVPQVRSLDQSYFLYILMISMTTLNTLLSDSLLTIA